MHLYGKQNLLYIQILKLEKKNAELYPELGI
jgi:hypothetical protein